MVLLIDNYDSFTYNLYHIARECDEVMVVKNDEITIDEIKKLNPSHILLSPGPKRPGDAGILMEVIDKCRDIPIFGVCLGHQAIGKVFGGKVDYAKKLVHGEGVEVNIDNSVDVFAHLEDKIKGARYNSLCVCKKGLPDCLQIIATDNDGEIMGIKHKDYNIYGVQFHPESILTEGGDMIIKTFLKK